jgi:ssDNA-binding Zn-finger/Zn-ribbon topoisomerase 1
MDQDYSKNGKCEICANFVRLTMAEKKTPLIQTIISSPQYPQGEELTGVCCHSLQSPLLLFNTLIFNDQYHCELYTKGFYKESLGIPCPECGKGSLTISRPMIKGNPVIIIGCSNYPACKFSKKQVQLDVPCRTCGTKLMLSAGKILRIFCPKCLRPLSIPVTIRIWPALSKPQGGCAHFNDNTICLHCGESRHERKSLLEIESAELLKRSYKQAEQLKKSFRVRQTLKDIADIPDERTYREYLDGGKYIDHELYIPDELMDDPDYLEDVEDYNDYSDEFNEILNEETDGEWLSI